VASVSASRQWNIYGEGLGGDVEFRILGPVELWVAGERSNIGTAKERSLLAILLLTPGQPVTAEKLIDRIWDEHAPAKARHTLYTYITRLRRRLHQATGESARLLWRSGAYILEVDPDTIDLHRFRQLRLQARALADSGDTSAAARLSRDAEQLWRGEPFADLDSTWLRRTRERLEAQLLAVILDRVAIELNLGNHVDLVPELSDLVNQHPLTESLAEYLMIALYRCGRQANALETYRRARQRLIHELGAEPGPNLKRTHERVLRGDPELTAAPQTTHVKPPNNLPRDIPHFTGREEVITDFLAAVGGGHPGTAVAIHAIDGMPGVGKTALAIHLAHRLASDYSDGRLYLNLHAHDPTQEPLDPAIALEVVLRTLNVPASQIPLSLQERAALWRSQMADRRILMILDDVAGQQQIRPLLPGAPGCLVLITSRRRLAGLEGTRPLSLEPLHPDEAAALFTRIVGDHQSMDPDSVTEAVGLCSHLPLAIELAGSRLRHRPAWHVTDLVSRLSRPLNRLIEIRGENIEIATAFDLSYRDLNNQQQRALRRLALHPGSNFASTAASALIDAVPAEAERLLDDLVDHHLIEEPTLGRYRFHDLVREYALNRTADEEAQPAIRRLLDAYLANADQADRLLHPHRRRIDIDIGHRPQLETEQQARAWLEDECDNLLSAARHAAEGQWPTHAVLLAHVLAHFLNESGRWDEATLAHQRATEIWRSLGDRNGLAQALFELSVIRWRTSCYDDALSAAQSALDIYNALGDQHGQGKVQDHIGLIYWQSARFTNALSHLNQALAIRAAIGGRRDQADTLSHLAIIWWHIGDYDQAMQKLSAALPIYQEISYRQGEMEALNNLGDVYQRLGHHDKSIGLYQQALDIADSIAGPRNKAILLNNLGNAHHFTGRLPDAFTHLRKALEIYRTIGDRRNIADALNNVGQTYQSAGQYGEALIHHERALAIASEINDAFEQARALRGASDVHRFSGRYNQALAGYRSALTLTRHIGDPYEEARTLEGIGATAICSRDHPKAQACWQQALDIYERLGVPEATTLRAQLADMRTTGRPAARPWNSTYGQATEG
jgi:DNA-binding SARP family transcriptional activator/tetratricopeptide (TPR) repeat protein